MTRERAKELLPIIEAYAAGKPIEYWSEGEWVPIDHVCWVHNAQYRIKHLPKEYYAEVKTTSETILRGWLWDTEERAVEQAAMSKCKVVKVREVPE